MPLSSLSQFENKQRRHDLKNQVIKDLPDNISGIHAF